MTKNYECGNCGFIWNENYEDGTPRSIEHASGDICPECNCSQKVEEDNGEVYELN